MCNALNLEFLKPKSLRLPNNNSEWFFIALKLNEALTTVLPHWSEYSPTTQEVAGLIPAQ
jgi:hypothetical protein